ncbi:hypothetical protein [Metamycoplasma hominis]|uniref:hypothetical protein n=1 Tax=Metamycoplasma hominis TaxID=2098 RepID=UPI001588FCBF|nr:hypothetical protein [Metamycoplasma hominis]QKX40290.1 hypothetical protein HU160_00125 [Metamycoplasma hominis]QKX41284.1 hypothetical protein HU161_02455 [Metamycoplasma hominis]
MNSGTSGVETLKQALGTLFEQINPFVSLIAGYAVVIFALIAIAMTFFAIASLKTAKTQTSKKEAKSRIVGIWLSFGFLIFFVVLIPVILKVATTFLAN